MGAINVANFNEFDMQLDMTMPFALDQLPAPDTWMAAAAQTMARRQDITLLDSEMGDSSLTLGSVGIDKRGRSSRGRSSLSSAIDNTMEEDDDEEEEGVDGLADDWAATEFDPRDESADLMGEDEIIAAAPDEESIEFGRNASTSRGARGLSISGIESEGRASLESGMKLGAEFGEDIEPLEPLQDDDEEQMDNGIPEDDAPLDDFADMDGPSLGGPSLGEEDDVVSPVKRKIKSSVNKKKRALPLDEVTEMSRSQLKENIQDISNIVRMALPPRQRPRLNGPMKKFPILEERMRMPNVTGIAPELREMFSWTMRDDPLPFRLRRGYNYAGPVNKKARTGAGSAISLNSEPEDDKASVANSGVGEEPEEVEEMRGEGEEQGEEQQDEFDFQAQEDEFQPEEEDYGFAGEEEEMPPPLDMSTTMDSGNGSFLANAGRFELGAVNDIQADDDTLSSNGYASEEEISKAQWHPHTKKVMTMLEGEFDKKDVVSYNEVCGISKGSKVGRRTAAGVFFELLQLKTWDYIEVDQKCSYDDISVTKGGLFDEGIPTARADQ